MRHWTNAFALAALPMLACEGERSPGSSEPTLSSPFADVTEASGIAFHHEGDASDRYRLPEEMGPGGALLDADGDGDLDVFLVQSGALPPTPGAPVGRLFRNEGGLRFADVSDASLPAVAVAGYGMGAAAADADGDGDVDLLVTRLGPNVFLRNDGGRFVDATGEAGLGDPEFGSGAAFADYDRDGVTDVFVVNYVAWSEAKERPCYDPRGLRDYCNPMEYEGASPDRLYRGVGGGRFQDVTERAGISAAKGNGLGVVWQDVTDDGWPDLYVANDQTPGFLWINQRDGTFVEDAALRGAAYNEDGLAIAGMGVAAEDLDADGDVDFLVTNIHDQTHLALRNDGGVFSDVSHAWGFGGWGVPYTGFGVALGDFDHDGRWDGVIGNGAVNRLTEPTRAGHVYAEPNQLIRQGEGGVFTDASAEVRAAFAPDEMTRGLLAGDLDDDGDLDVVMLNNRGPARVFRNDGAKGHWLVLDVVDDAGAPAIGARVEVLAGERTWSRHVRPNVGYLSSQDPRVHVGLGTHARADTLRVTWPDGRVTERTNVEANVRLRVAPGPR